MKHTLVRENNRWLGIILTAVLLVLLFASPGVRVAAAQSEPTAYVNAPQLNVRSGPGAGYDPVASVSNGEMLFLLGRDSLGSWVQVRLTNGVIGWVSSYYITPSVPISSLQVVATAEPQARVDAAALNVRSGPGLTYPVITVIHQGDYVNLLGRNAGSSWLYVRVEGGFFGWIASGEVTATVPFRSLPISTATGQMTGTTPGTGTTVITTTGQTPVVIPGMPIPGQPPTTSTTTTPPTSSTTTTTPTVPTGAVARVNAAVLNVRSGPGPGYSVIGQVGQGDYLSMIGRDSLSSWIQIVLPDGTQGWVSYYYLTALTPVRNLPVTARYQPVCQVRTGALNVHSGPGVWFPVVAVATQNQYLTLIGRIPDSTWFKVLINGQEGWLDASYVYTAYPIKDLPIFRLSEEVFG